MEGIIESAKKYSDLGLHLVAIKEGSKGPTTKNWHNQGINVSDLNEQLNIGIIHNLSSTCSIDIDSREEAIKIFEGYNRFDGRSAEWALHRGVNFLKDNFNIED